MQSVRILSRASSWSKQCYSPSWINTQHIQSWPYKLTIRCIQMTTRTGEPFNRPALEQILNQHFYLYQSFPMYQPTKGLYDLGPPMAALQANFIEQFRKFFILREHMMEIDPVILTPYQVLKASGHVDKFEDLMCRDLVTGEMHRADHLLKETLEALLQTAPKKERPKLREMMVKADNSSIRELNELILELNLKSPAGNELSLVQPINLMLSTNLGTQGKTPVFLRPETAQAHFTAFYELFHANGEHFPFASACIGKSFRNEISPRSGLLRTKEFTMAEIEYFYHPEKLHLLPKLTSLAHVEMQFLSRDDQQSDYSNSTGQSMTIKHAVDRGLVTNDAMAFFLAKIHIFLTKLIGLDAKKLRYRQHRHDELSHYSKDTWDAEVLTSFGWIEIVGCADRDCYDMTKHNKAKISPESRKEDPKSPLSDTEISQIDAQVKIPAVIEPSFGIGRILTALIEHSYWQDKVTTKNTTANSQEKEHQNKKFPEGRAVLSFLPHMAPNLVSVAKSKAKVNSALLHDLDEALADMGCAYQVCGMEAEGGKEEEKEEGEAKFRRERPCSHGWDHHENIGRRYRNADIRGTPFFITVDGASEKDGSVTLRERDSMIQVRASVKDVLLAVENMWRGKETWDDVLLRLKRFEFRKDVDAQSS